MIGKVSLNEGCADFIRESCAPVRVKVRDQDLSAGGGKLRGGGRANPARAARDQRPPTLEAASRHRISAR
jgi:hypothetical protein